MNSADGDQRKSHRNRSKRLVRRSESFLSNSDSWRWLLRADLASNTLVTSAEKEATASTGGNLQEWRLMVVLEMIWFWLWFAYLFEYPPRNIADCFSLKIHRMAHHYCAERTLQPLQEDFQSSRLIHASGKEPDDLRPNDEGMCSHDGDLARSHEPARVLENIFKIFSQSREFNCKGKNLTLKSDSANCVMQALRRLDCLMILLADDTTDRRNASRTLMLAQHIHWVSRAIHRKALRRVERVTTFMPKTLSLCCAFIDSPLRHSRRSNHASTWRDASRIIGRLKQISFEIIGIFICLLINFLLTQMICRPGKLWNHWSEVDVA